MLDPLDRPEAGSAPDPEQLPLGMFEGIPLVPVETFGPDDEVIIVPVREPPVCGEWSYDDSELEEPRFVARRIDGVAAPTMKATPIAPIRTVVDSRPAGQPAPRRSVPVAGSVVTIAGAARPDVAPSRAMRPSMEALRLAFEQSPGDTARALAYVAALEKKNDAAAALTVLDRAEAAGGDAFLILCARASALGATLKYDDAESMIKKAAKLRPEAPEVFLQMGILACRRARWREAVEPLKRAIALAPENASAHYHVGEALNQTDDKPGALAAYQRAAELEPDHWRALKGVGIVLDRLGRSPEAADFYRRARDAQRA
ncbi:MAG: tetratricopeptide repeat protein [Gemmatimonadetes bacterium]|nr:tetratricopeptide repeat protein [Gemmatimonadota bacterium]